MGSPFVPSFNIPVITGAVTLAAVSCQLDMRKYFA